MKYKVTDSKHKTHIVTLNEFVPNAEFLEEGTPEWGDAAAPLAKAINEIPVDWEAIDDTP